MPSTMRLQAPQQVQGLCFASKAILLEIIILLSADRALDMQFTA